MQMVKKFKIFFGCQFDDTIRRQGFGRTLFFDRQNRCRTVYGAAGRGKNHFFDALFYRHLKQADRTFKVCLYIIKRIQIGRSRQHCTHQMNHQIYTFKDFGVILDFSEITIAQLNPVKNVSKIFQIAIRPLKDPYPMTGGNQGVNDMRTDKTGPTQNQIVHFINDP